MSENKGKKNKKHNTQTQNDVSNDATYVTTKIASQRLGVHVLTLHNWANNGSIDTIRTPGNHRKYNVDKYLKQQEEGHVPEKKTKNDQHKDQKKQNNENIDMQDKVNVCYVRVSCIKNKNILKTQKTDLSEHYPNSMIIEDVGSSTNFDKPGFKQLINMINNKMVNNVIIANRSNLSKYLIEMISFLLVQNDGGSVIINEYDKSIDSVKNLTNDLIDDMLQTLNTYSTELMELKKQINL